MQINIPQILICLRVYAKTGSAGLLLISLLWLIRNVESTKYPDNKSLVEYPQMFQVPAFVRL